MPLSTDFTESPVRNMKDLIKTRRRPTVRQTFSNRSRPRGRCSLAFSCRLELNPQSAKNSVQGHSFAPQGSIRMDVTNSGKSLMRFKLA